MLKLFNEILVHCQGFFFTEDEQLIKTNANYNNIIDTLYTLNVYITENLYDESTIYKIYSLLSPGF